MGQIFHKNIMTIEEQKRVFEAVRFQDDDEDDDEDEDEEDEMVDPLEVARGRCNSQPTGKALTAELQKCTERVEADEETEETCTQELFDFLTHRDTCVGQLFKA